MNIDEEKIDEVVLALLQLTLDDRYSAAWKQFSFDVMNRLHQKGYILNPVNKNKSVVLTDSGLERSKELFSKHFQQCNITQRN